MDDLAFRLLDLLGDRGCVELLAVLELDEPERGALIGQLYAGGRGQKLAELLTDVEVDDLTRLRLIGALWEVLGPRALPAADRGPPFSDGIAFASDRWRPRRSRPSLGPPEGQTACVSSNSV